MTGPDKMAGSALAADRPASKLTSPLVRWWVLYRKEMLESLRSFKLLWMPLVFILIGAMQPVMLHMLPDLLASAGSLPESVLHEIPRPQAFEVLAQTLGQYDTMGALITALAFMAVVSGERASGTAALMLTKPISAAAFITSKWAGLLTITMLSFSAGYAAAWYYTYVLFGAVGAGKFLGSLLLYGLWLVFIGTCTLLFGSLLKSGAAAAFAALGTAAVLSIVSSLYTEQLAWSPGRLPSYASALLTGGDPGSAAAGAAAFTVVCLIAACAGAVAALRTKPSVD
ncbi:ABC transporter permease [Paenibacillus sambharensis]|uniref:ABC transporter permease n=1 Tax=Paenibacillus sambharensis TaxID=1803190 RepID=A0A2W1LL54_9BACL|nr:ABC transporter permease subunit [Paenibacillus sambharensis]PZD95692.1 ABC transporter permease [Paenibacillus sambharensis]